MTRFGLELFPGHSVDIYLFTEVENTAHIQACLSLLDCAVVNASLILDVLQVAMAACKAWLCKAKDEMRTRNINTELLYRLSPSTNVTASLATFGISNNTYLLFVKFDAQDDVRISGHLFSSMRSSVQP